MNHRDTKEPKATIVAICKLFMFCIACVFLLSLLVFAFVEDSRISLEMHADFPVTTEVIEVPLNHNVPIYTEREYSGWVTITISGSVLRNGEFFHDAMYQFVYQFDNAYLQFRGFLIDGAYAFMFRAPGPTYNDENVYKFRHSLGGHMEERAIGFQLINEASRDLEAWFTVEVISDGYNGKSREKK